ECGRVFNHAPICRLPMQPDVLHDIFRLRRASEHAVGDAEKTLTHIGKSRKAVVVVPGLGVKAMERSSLEQRLRCSCHNASPSEDIRLCGVGCFSVCVMTGVL